MLGEAACLLGNWICGLDCVGGRSWLVAGLGGKGGAFRDEGVKG